MAYRPIYYDTETTGVKAGKDRIIEIAAYDPVEKREFCSFTNPEMPIPEESTKITGITDAMVQDAPPIQEVLTSFEAFCQGDVVLVAHNNDAFDLPFLQAEYQRAGLTCPSWRTFDSLKWARKYRPDLPRHSLQYLREAYGVAANQAHRALDDVHVLYQIFSVMIGDLSWETIFELMKAKPRVLKMPFGKHAGKPLSEVPQNYLQWLAGSGAFDKKENEELKEQLEKLGKL